MIRKSILAWAREDFKTLRCVAAGLRLTPLARVELRVGRPAQEELLYGFE
jgi:hypothetical protein